MERKYAKRKARRVYEHMDKTMAYCMELAEAFEEDHPLEAKAIITVAKMVLGAQNLLYQWYAHVWGQAPAAWNTKGQENNNE